MSLGIQCEALRIPCDGKKKVINYIFKLDINGRYGHPTYQSMELSIVTF